MFRLTSIEFVFRLFFFAVVCGAMRLNVAPATPRVFLIGDSVTWGQGVFCQECMYRSILQEKIHSAGSPATVEFFARCAATVQNNYKLSPFERDPRLLKSLDEIDFAELEDLSLSMERSIANMSSSPDLSASEMRRDVIRDRGALYAHIHEDLCPRQTWISRALDICMALDQILYNPFRPFVTTAAYRRLMNTTIDADDAVVIFLGINDATEVHFKLGGKTSEFNADNFRSQYLSLYGDLLSRGASPAKVHFVTAHPVCQTLKFYPHHKVEKMKEVNNLIRRLAHEMGSHLIDLERKFNCSAGENVAPRDGLHPDENGAARIAVSIFDELLVSESVKVAERYVQPSAGEVPPPTCTCNVKDQLAGLLMNTNAQESCLN